MIDGVHKGKAGFTLVELLVAAIAASVLAITAGALLYAGILNWMKDRASMQLQGDALFTMDIFSRAIRPASISDVTRADTVLTIGKKSFYRAGNTLYYDPDITLSGNETAIVPNKVTNLSFTKDLVMHSVTVNMTLTDKGRTVALNFNVGNRN